MAKKVTMHHPKLGRTVTVPSERAARVHRKHGWQDGPLPGPAATTLRGKKING